MDVRVQDYVDDKLQSAADLESLDSLLESVKQQQDLLKKQLHDARREHAEAQDAVREHTAAIKRKAHEFEQAQRDIDRRLLIVTQSETSDEAVQKFEESMERLRKLDVAAAYVELLQEVDALRSECVSLLGQDDDAALVPYQRLQQLVASLKPLQNAAEGAAPHLLDHIVATVQSLRETIQKSFSENLEKTLSKMNWPKSTDRVALALEGEWTTNVGRLLDLQKQDLEARELLAGNVPKDVPPVLLPFEVLVHPLHQRFTYHFGGNKPTNRLDKPEYFLNHITDLIANYSDFVQDNLQPLLLKHFRRSDLAFTPAYIDATSAFIVALLPMVKDKLYKVATQITTQPSLLSHLVQEVIQFDNTLKDSYSFTPSSPSADWGGLSYFLLDTCGYFNTWLAAERDFALSRYQAILDSPDAGKLDYDAVTADATKPSKAAVRLNDLLETITERYRYLTDYDQRISFLIDIQITIFDTYHRRLQDALDAYLSLTSRLGRTMQTVSKEELAELQGVKGLDRLCRIFGSADYLERAMRDWSDDVFFLELWAELDYRHKHRQSGTGTLSNWQEVRQKTSSALGAQADDGGLEGALFDETASSYRRLRARSEKVLIDALKYDVEQSLSPYTSIRTWASLSSSSTTTPAGAEGGGGSVTAELDSTLNLLAESFGFLRQALGKAPLRRVGRAICHAIQEQLWSRVLQGKSSFSTAGVAQLTVDLRALCATLDHSLGSGQAQGGLRKLLEGVALLGLPVRGEIRRGGRSEEEEEEEEKDGLAWEEEEEGNGEPTMAVRGKGKTLSLFQVERLVFMDNESARHVLEELGLETLSENEARMVLRQRVEISS